MNCPNCGSSDIEILDIYDTDKSCGSYVEEGNAICDNCNNEFDFRKTYDLIINHIEYK